VAAPIGRRTVLVAFLIGYFLLEKAAAAESPCSGLDPSGPRIFAAEREDKGLVATITIETNRGIPSALIEYLSNKGFRSILDFLDNLPLTESGTACPGRNEWGEKCQTLFWNIYAGVNGTDYPKPDELGDMVDRLNSADCSLWPPAISLSYEAFTAFMALCFCTIVPTILLCCCVLGAVLGVVTCCCSCCDSDDEPPLSSGRVAPAPEGQASKDEYKPIGGEVGAVDEGGYGSFI
jgi:hypothetical protein